MRLEESKMLRDKGFKVTPGRVSILEIFSKHHKPINAEYIYRKMKGKNINQVTIYRTLTNFEQEGIIKRVDLRKDSTFYELNGRHHHHLVCTNCGVIEDFAFCGVEDMTKKVLGKSSKFNNVQQHSFELFGVCKMCTKR